MLAFYGTDDETILYSGIVAFDEKADALGNDCELYTFEGESHPSLLERPELMQESRRFLIAHKYLER